MKLIVESSLRIKPVILVHIEHNSQLSKSPTLTLGVTLSLLAQILQYSVVLFTESLERPVVIPQETLMIKMLKVHPLECILRITKVVI